MWLSNGEQENYLRAEIGIYSFLTSRLKPFIGASQLASCKIIFAETDFYMSSSSAEYFNELSKMSGYDVIAQYPSQGPTNRK